MNGLKNGECGSELKIWKPFNILNHIYDIYSEWYNETCNTEYHSKYEKGETILEYN